MVSLALWSAPHKGTPHRLTASPPETEAELENWVRADPSLVRDGLIVVAQQLIFPSKERLDLLCIENRSRWLVVELKRDRLPREVAAQALDYVSLLAAMPREELQGRLEPHLANAPQDTKDLVGDLLEAESAESPRDVAAVVVGVVADEPLLRITRYLTDQYQVPISVIELKAFTSPSGDVLIVREETGNEADPDTADAPKPPVSVDERWARVQTAATAVGFGSALESVRTILRDSPIYLRPYTRSVMLTPPTNRTRYLAVIGFGSDTTAVVKYGQAEFAEFYPSLDADAFASALGSSDAKLTPAELITFAERLAEQLAGLPTDAEP